MFIMGLINLKKNKCGYLISMYTYKHLNSPSRVKGRNFDVYRKGGNFIYGIIFK
jgi:hypothetical protein